MTWLKRIVRKEASSTRAPAPTAAAAAPEPRPGDPPAARVAAILACTDRARALAWCAELAGDEWLAAVAIDGRFAELRLAAARRIENEAVLSRVAEASRKRDKGLYRHCQDLLTARRAAADTARRASGIASALQGLLEATPLPITRLIELEHELGELPATDPAVAACQPLLAEAHRRLRQQAEVQRELSRAEAAVGELQAAVFAGKEWPGPATLADWQARHAMLADIISAAPPWLAALPATQRARERLAVVAAALATLSEDHRRLQACEEFLATLGGNTRIDAEVARRWAALEKPAHAKARARIVDRWQALAAPSAAAPKAARPAGDAKRPGLPGKADREHWQRTLAALEQAIAQGHLAEAARLDGELGGAPPDAALDERRQHARAELTKLNGWARWGSDQARDHLVEAAEALREAGLPTEALARQVPALRAAWKRLNGQGHPRKEQWERFDAALTAAFAPVAAQRAEEAVRQQAAREAKEALCARLEAQLRGPDWDAQPFAGRERWRHDAIACWRATGLAGYRDERALRKRFDALIAEVDRQLEKARAAERDRRRQLIDAATAVAAALGEDGDAPPDAAALAEAVVAIKALQQRWQPPPGTLHLPRQEERLLWQTFRAACDRVFVRREALRRQNAERRAAETSARQAELDAFAAALAAAGDDAKALRQAMQQFGAVAANNEARAQSLWREAQTKLAGAQAAGHRSRYALIARKAAIAEALEAAALAGQADEARIAQARRDWEALPALAADDETALRQRLSAAPGIDAAALAAGREARAARLLDLEIAYGLPTPPAFAEARRQRQLARLAQHFGGDAATVDGSDPVLRWYAIAALPDPALEARIVAVIERRVDAALAAAAPGLRPAAPPPREDTATGRHRGPRRGGGGHARRAQS